MLAQRNHHHPRELPIGHSAPPVVLFVCQHGSAKSVIAARLMQRLAADRGVQVDCRSAGVQPDAAIPANVVAGLGADGIDVSATRPAPISHRAIEDAQYVVSFGCELAPLGASSALRWDDVPAVSAGYARARDAIAARLHPLIDEIEASMRA